MTILKDALTKIPPNIAFSEISTYENYSNIDFLYYEITLASPNIDYSEMSTYENHSEHRPCWNVHLRELFQKIDILAIRNYVSFSKHWLFWNEYLPKHLLTLTFLKYTLTRSTQKIWNEHLRKLFRIHGLFRNMHLRELLHKSTFWNMELR